MKVKLSCPYAEYRDGMQIWCTRRACWCGHVYFRTCRGWWALTPEADRCPVRQEGEKP